MHKSLDELDGVFTYIAVTKDELGVAKDELAAKPLVLYESDDLVALASEEIAIRRSSTTRSTRTTPTSARCWCGSGRGAADHVRRTRTRGARRGGAAHGRRRGRRRDLRRARAHHPHDQPRAAPPSVRGRRRRGRRPEPAGSPLARRRDPAPLQDHVRGLARLLRVRPHRRARDPHHGPGRLVRLREHDVGSRRGGRQRRLAHGRRDARRRPRRQGPRRRAHGYRPEGRNDHRARFRRLDDRVHDAARPADPLRRRRARVSATRCTTGRSTSPAR